MPIGKFIPFDLADMGPRFFARPTGFDMECPQCGRLLLVGSGRRDDKQYNRVTGVVTCPMNTRPGKPGCGVQFLIGIVAWNLTHSTQKARPRDQRPNARQLAELRQAARGVWQKQRLTRGDPVNTIQELPDDDEEK